MEDFRDRIKFIPKDKYKMPEGIKDFPYYKMYEKDGTLVGRVNQKHELIQNKWLEGVSCFVINEKGEILLEGRANTGLTPKKIDLVSGHMDKEETPEQSMKRELEEEIGLKVTSNSQLRQLGTIPLVFVSGQSKRKFRITFFSCQYHGEQITKQDEEIDSISWLPMEEVFDLIREGKTKFPYDIKLEEIFQKVQAGREKNRGREEK